MHDSVIQPVRRKSELSRLNLGRWIPGNGNAYHCAGRGRNQATVEKSWRHKGNCGKKDEQQESCIEETGEEVSDKEEAQLTPYWLATQPAVMKPESPVPVNRGIHEFLYVGHLDAQPDIVRRVVVDRDVIQAAIGREKQRLVRR